MLCYDMLYYTYYTILYHIAYLYITNFLQIRKFSQRIKQRIKTLNQWIKPLKGLNLPMDYYQD